MKPAIFISPDSANRALIREARTHGINMDTLVANAKVKPVLNRGQVLGYAAFLPSLPSGYIVEEMV